MRDLLEIFGKSRAIIFDMDGVILDSEPVYDASVTSHLQELGVEVDPGIFDSTRGTTVIEFWSLLQKRFNLQESVDRLVSDSILRLDEYFSTNESVRPMPLLHEFMDYLNSLDKRLAIASSSRLNRISIILERFQIHSRFEVKVSGDDVKLGKPHPEIFQIAAKKLGLAPRDCLVIEDSTNGVKAAKAAGMACLGFQGSLENKQDLSGADFVVKDFGHLKSLIHDFV